MWINVKVFLIFFEKNIDWIHLKLKQISLNGSVANLCSIHQVDSFMMRIFQSIQKHNAILGLNPPELFQMHPFNWRNVLCLFIFGQFFLLSCAFLFLKAEGFSQYAESFYVTSNMLASFFNFAVRVFKSQELNELVQNFEKAINKRKYFKSIWIDDISEYSLPGLENERSKAIYKDVNAKVEKWTQLLNFSCMNITLPCLLVPNFIICYVTYFLSDAGSDAFFLPFPIWYVFYAHKF